MMNLPKIKGKKGNAGTFNTMKTGGLAFVVAIIVLGAGALVLTEFDAELTGEAQDVTGNGTAGLLELAGFAPTLAVIFAVVLIIGLVGGIALSRR